MVDGDLYTDTKCTLESTAALPISWETMPNLQDLSEFLKRLLPDSVSSHFVPLLPETCTPEEICFDTPSQAVSFFPQLPNKQVHAAAQSLLLCEFLRHEQMGVFHGLLISLRQTLSHPRPEWALVHFLAQQTGGFAEIRASWGDPLASAGLPLKTAQQFKLMHGKRHMGSLILSMPAEWEAIFPLAAEFALMARLQSAAASIARRRVGERTLENMLSKGEVSSLGAEIFAVGVASYKHEPTTGANARAAHAYALDILASVGEGYFSERGSRCLCTVREDKVIWLWRTRELAKEAEQLYSALRISLEQPFKLGISRPHSKGEVRAAFQEAKQALAATRDPDAYTIFEQLDPLYGLLVSGTLSTIRTQVLSQLAELADDGKTENTLRAYLSHKGSLAELAQQQHVHVNTLRYRLKRAEEALGASLQEPSMLARLYLAFEAEASPLPFDEF